MSGHRATAIPGLVAMAAGTMAMLWLLGTLVHAGWAHSFDSAIYVRSLWGAAHGSWWNPLVDLHVLSIHSNLVLLVMAPLTRWASAADVLIAAQALSYGATLAVVATAASRLGLRRGLTPAGAAALGLWLTAVAAATPMVTNPFLFDIRPDLIGVPLLTAGLVRAWERDRFDAVAIALMLLALPVREEHMLVIVGALGADGLRRLLVRRPGLPLGARIRELAGHTLGIGVAVGWWAGYWFVVRPAIGDGSADVASSIAGEFLSTGSLARARYAVEALVLFAFGLGGLSTLGWRWLGAAIPGVLLLLATVRMPELGLNFHYVMFITPGLLVASLAGLERLLARPPASRTGRSVGFALLSAVALATYVSSSALPGGGRYREDNFGPLGSSTEEARLRGLDLATMHALARAVPSDQGVALPYGIVADVAERQFVWSSETIVDRVREGQGVPSELVWLGLAGRDVSSVGRWAVDVAGFRAVAGVGGRLVLLSRAPVTPQWEDFGAVAAGCPTPVAAWDTHGVRLCDARWAADGTIHVEVERASVVDTPMALGVVPPGGTEPFVELRGQRGVVPLRHVDTGWRLPMTTLAPIDAPAVEIVLQTPEGVVTRLRLPRPGRAGSRTEP